MQRFLHHSLLLLLFCLANGYVESIYAASSASSTKELLMLKNLLQPPVAKKEPHNITVHNDTRTDEYHWLRDKNYPKVNDRDILAYLNAENIYSESFLKPLEPLTHALFEELKSRVKLDDSTVPAQRDNYWYYTRFEPQAEYPLYCRKKDSLEAPEEIILNIPDLAKGHKYFQLGTLSVSPDHTLLAYSVDIDGSERFTVHFINLKDPSKSYETIPQTIGGLVWAEDNATLFYTLVNDQWRRDKVMRHTLGTPVVRDTLVFEEKDSQFFVSVSKSLSKEFIFINSDSKDTTEIHFTSAKFPDHPLQVIEPRTEKREYDVTHHGDYFYINTNDTGPNYRLVKASVNQPGKAHWQEIIPTTASFYLTGNLAFKDFMVVGGRERGLPVLKIFSYDTEKMESITFPDPAYEVNLSSNLTYDARTIRLSYSSMIRPNTVYDYDVTTKSFAIKKVQEIPSGYDATLYGTERITAMARDGTEVPISIVYRKETRAQGSAPLILYGYGSYGHSIPPSFSTHRLSLLDRGFIFAIAHVRGGDEMGRKWYEEGKFLKKKNTFNDFIDCTQTLIDKGYTRKGEVAIWGGSAGGMLIGVALNEAASLYKAAIAEVPFVDVVNTMLDDTLPLTPPEYKEWGNPKESKEFYHYIKSYSPYDNIREQPYPHLFVQAALNDPRVTYWEPAKWVAKLREVKARTNDGTLLLLKINMGAGHGGASGRFDYLQELAEKYTFLLAAFGRTEVK